MAQAQSWAVSLAGETQRPRAGSGYVLETLAPDYTCSLPLLCSWATLRSVSQEIKAGARGSTGAQEELDLWHLWQGQLTMSSWTRAGVAIDSSFTLSFLGSFSIAKFTEGSVVTLFPSVPRT